MQNIEEIEQQITIATLTVFEQVKWDEYIYNAYYMYPGISKKMKLTLLYENNELPIGHLISSAELFKIDDAIDPIDDYYLESQGSDSTRFNRITYRIFSDGKIESKYFWDGEYYLDNLFSRTRVFPQMLNERMLMLMFEGQFRKKRWDSAIFEFNIADGQVNFKGTASNKRFKEIPVEITLASSDVENIIEHHQKTNEGELKDRWKPWNKLVLRSPHNDIDFDKDVDYLLE
ncbi:hypothetical protein ABID42_001571 [Arcicella rosea]|uniref:hypothetical protein n=1 Tax=Arcicella rosea TaxID=502909 RepID=UPI00345D5D59|eukprot:GDKJ01026494.1.p3 GENE.GDKJ01026494.1~~GDKJ01026494.1.p3  ORF type:complete len:231 (+),score=18.57 GDKJ01026494.1:977-1669(+)